MIDRIHTASPLPADEAVTLAWAMTTTKLTTNEITGPRIEYPEGAKFVILRGQLARQVREVGAIKGLDPAGKSVWLPLAHITKTTPPDHVPATARTAEPALA